MTVGQGEFHDPGEVGVAPLIITDPTTDRYHTFSFIPWWKPDVVRNAKIMVVGAGALGNEALKNLALLGVGQTFVVDFDTIEYANLSRSVLYRPSDNGRRKAEVAAERVHDLNPDVATQYFHGDVIYDLGLGVFRRMDVIVGCLDNRAARLAVNRYAWYLGKTYVDGGIDAMNGEVRTFVPGEGACYECTLTDEDMQNIDARFSCPGLARNDILEGRTPTTPTIASIVGAIEVQEALKVLHGMEVGPGTAFVFKGLVNDGYVTKLPIKHECQSHWRWGHIIELSQCQAETTTVGELLEIVRRELGPDARLELRGGLGRDLVTALECRDCHTTDPILRPKNRLSVQEGLCPRCGRDRHPTTTYIISGNEPFLGVTLSEIGIPPLHILPAQDDLGNKAFFELTGDLSLYPKLQSTTE